MEFAFWRATANRRLEVISAHPNGIAEIETGSVNGTTIELATADLASAPTAKSVVRLQRRFVVEGATLTYDLEMAAVGQELQPHLHAVLQRQTPPDER